MTKLDEILLYRIYSSKSDIFIGFQDLTLVPGQIYPI
jgi:hypothetical protein